MLIIKLKAEDFKFKDEIAKILEDRISELKSIEFSVEYDQDFTCVNYADDEILATRVFNILISTLEELKHRSAMELLGAIEEAGIYD